MNTASRPDSKHFPEPAFSQSAARSDSVSIARLLELGDDTRIQNPKLQKTAGRNPRWYIRPYVPVHTATGIVAKQQYIYLGACKEVGKRKAVASKNKVMETINRHQFVVSSQLPFGDFIDTWLKTFVLAPGNLSSATQQKYQSQVQSRIRPTFGHLRMGEIDTRGVDDWLCSMAAEGESYNYRKDLRHTLSGIFTKARKWGVWREQNPAMDATVGRARGAREKRKLTDEQMRQILVGLPVELAMICKLALLTLRISEVLGLQEKHLEFYAGVGVDDDTPENLQKERYELESVKAGVEGRLDSGLLCERPYQSAKASYAGPGKHNSPNFACISERRESASVIDLRGNATPAGLEPARQHRISGTIHIRQRCYLGNIDACKTRKSARDIPMGILAPQLRAMCTGDPERFLFGGWTYSKGQAALRARAESLGLYWEGFGFHQFRREAKTGLGATGIDPAQLMRLGGWSDMETAMGYTLADSGEQDKAVRKFQEKVRVQ